MSVYKHRVIKQVHSHLKLIPHYLCKVNLILQQMMARNVISKHKRTTSSVHDQTIAYS